MSREWLVEGSVADWRARACLLWSGGREGAELVERAFPEAWIDVAICLVRASASTAVCRQRRLISQGTSRGREQGQPGEGQVLGQGAGLS